MKEVTISLGSGECGTNKPFGYSTTPVSDAAEFRIFFIDISQFSRPVQFGVCTAGIFCVYLLYGYILELIFTFPGFTFGFFLTLFQFVAVSVLSFVERLAETNCCTRRIPLQFYCVLAFLMFMSMGFSNASLPYLNYPTQVIFKSSKLIPVMVGGIIIQHKKYGVLDYIAVSCLSFGVVMFALADSQIYPRFSYMGCILIAIALTADTLIGNVQEKWMKKFDARNNEVMLYSYSIGSVFLFALTVCTGEFWAAVRYSSKNPKILPLLFTFSFCSYFGVNIILNLVKSFDALLAITVTTCRKAITVMLSFLVFNKVFAFQYLWSGLLVLLGIYLNVLSRNRGYLTPLVQFIKSVQSKHSSESEFLA